MVRDPALLPGGYRLASWRVEESALPCRSCALSESWLSSAPATFNNIWLA